MEKKCGLGSERNVIYMYYVYIINISKAKTSSNPFDLCSIIKKCRYFFLFDPPTFKWTL